MFMPRGAKIFDSLIRHAETLSRAAEIFQRISEGDGMEFSKACAELERLESEGDDILHAVSDEVEKTFILPLDKEDIMELAEAMDDVLDHLEEAANRMDIYGLHGKDETTAKFASLISQCSEQILLCVNLIKAHKFKSAEFNVNREKIHVLENEGDMVHRKALVRLLGGAEKKGMDTLSIIKWKEIYQTLEDTLDLCERISILFDRLRIKYG